MFVNKKKQVVYATYEEVVVAYLVRQVLQNTCQYFYSNTQKCALYLRGGGGGGAILPGANNKKMISVSKIYYTVLFFEYLLGGGGGGGGGGDPPGTPGARINNTN